jgi:hypothetical protein
MDQKIYFEKPGNVAERDVAYCRYEKCFTCASNGMTSIGHVVSCVITGWRIDDE